MQQELIEKINHYINSNINKSNCIIDWLSTIILSEDKITTKTNIHQYKGNIKKLNNIIKGNRVERDKCIEYYGISCYICEFNWKEI